MKKRKFVIITGIDGSGKTSLLNQIQKLQDFKTTAWYKVSPFPTKDNIDPRKHFERIKNSKERFQFIRYYLEEERNQIHEFLNQEYNVVSDGFYFRAIAKEKILKTGTHLSLLELDLLKELEPIIMKLRVSFEEAWNRKREKVNSLETYGDSYHEFMEFQKDFSKEISLLTKDFPSYTFNSTISPNDLLNKIKKKLNEEF